MNFLTICQKLAQRADIPYSSFTDVESVSGELALVVDWAAQACLDIQSAQNQDSLRWKFLHEEYSRDTRATKSLDAGPAVDNGGGLVGIPITAHGFSSGDLVTLSGTTNYDGTYSADSTTTTDELVISATFVAETFVTTQTASVRDYEFYTADGINDFDLDSFCYYLKTDGANNKRPLRYVEYKKFREQYSDFSSQSAPAVITITPNNRLRLFPMMDAVYTVCADAFKKPQELTSNGDTPPWTEDLHMLVVWKALIDYAGFEESSSIFQHAAIRYDELMSNLLWRERYEQEEMVVRVV